MNDREELKALADQLTFAAENTLGCLYHQRKMLNDAATALRLAASRSSGAVREEARHLVSSARAFLRYFNPCNLAEDKSQQHQALSHQCDIVDAAIDALVPADRVRPTTRDDLRRLVDIVWNEATESTAVPSTKWADRLIATALAQTEGGKSLTSSDGSGSNAARTCDVPAASPSGDVTQAGHSPLIASDQERNRVRKDAGVAPGPSEATPAPADGTIPGSENMEARFDWLQSKAIDMGYVLVPEPEHPDSPHAQPAPADDAGVAWQAYDQRDGWVALPPRVDVETYRKEGVPVRPLYTHPAKAVDVEAVKQLQAFVNDPASATIPLKAIRTILSLLTTGNASSETEGGR